MRPVRLDALFAVDIIQGFGAWPYDLPAQMVDAASGASHKWLCAPEGCGILYLSDRARERIEPTSVGWISVDVPWNFEDREQAFKPNALGLGNRHRLRFPFLWTRAKPEASG